MRNSRIFGAVAILGLGVLMLYAAIELLVNRVYVEEGKSLLLRYKGPLLLGKRQFAQQGYFAKPGEVGVLEELRGPGRHFYCPIWWERRIIDDITILPGEVGIVTSKLGEDVPNTAFLVDEEVGHATRKGILRKVLTPGRHRINTYGYDVKKIQVDKQLVGQQEKISGWVVVPTGYVGVATLRWDDPLEQKVAGIQKDVLPPGIYAYNPREMVIDVIEVGLRVTSISVQKQKDQKGELVIDKSGEPVAIAESGIGFPSNDGFPIQLDFTAIWGVMPDQAPEVIRTFGGIEAVEQKVILPQSESICRNNGSKMGAVDLLIGQSRQKFQTTTQDEFRQVLKDKKLEFLYALVRHIYIPQDVRLPIQMGYVADELTLTREQEKLTATTEALLREAERKVELEKERIRVETDKMVAAKLAEGQKEAKEMDAETKQLVAEVEKQIAELDAQKIVALGEAKAKSEQMLQEAKAQKFKLAVEAFGQPEFYNRWIFADGLPEELDLRLFYAGEGTLWTDLKGVTPTIPLIPSPGEKDKSPRGER